MMRVLAASSSGEGSAVAGELVIVSPIVCPAGEEGECPDDCGSLFVGLDSGHATTVARVVERNDLSMEVLAEAIKAAVARAGVDLSDEDAAEWAQTVAEEASSHAVGTLLRVRHGDEVYAATPAGRPGRRGWRRH